LEYGTICEVRVLVDVPAVVLVRVIRVYCFTMNFPYLYSSGDGKELMPIRNANVFPLPLTF
jgi:hypothetical protein